MLMISVLLTFKCGLDRYGNAHCHHLPNCPGPGGIHPRTNRMVPARIGIRPYHPSPIYRDQT
jgi:hypothetical protein